MKDYIKFILGIVILCLSNDTFLSIVACFIIGWSINGILNDKK